MPTYVTDGHKDSHRRIQIAQNSTLFFTHKKIIGVPADCLTACDEGPGLCAHLITFLSILLVFVTIPFSLCFAVKVVQEYERVVIFRLGRLLSGGARGPGVFFVVPCVDSYQKVDMRTLTFDVPPQEVICSIT